MVKYIFLLILLLLFFPSLTFAQTPERYVTLVNPVRSQNLWQDKGKVFLQLDYIAEKKVPVTWLVQYGILVDPSTFESFQRMPPHNEIGVWLEVDENLAADSLVPYKIGEGDWARSDKVLLSGYFPPERKRMIDTLFSKFKNVFGYYPSSIGAWYIDTLSLDYMVDKYQIKTVLSVSDQYQTDTYGIWGTPWGTPYYPSRLNSLLPGRNMTDKLNVVKIQWAQRDPMKGYGLTVSDSTYSMQANDYVSHHNHSTSYFKKLIGEYLFSDNVLTQVTVGLEVGQEMVKFFEEYSRQLDYLIQLQSDGRLHFTTMSDFADKYKSIFHKNFASYFIRGSDIDNPKDEAFWYSSSFYRLGLLKMDDKLLIRDLRIYEKPYIFEDIFTAEENPVLKRFIPSVIDDLEKQNSKIIFSDAEKISAEKKEENVNLKVISKGTMHTLSLQPDKIFIDGQKLFSVTDPQKVFLDGISDKISLFLINLYKNKSHQWKRDWRYSYINGNYYIGLTVTPDQLLGVRSEFPFIGTFKFPFQTLSHFKSLPNFDPVLSLALNFINLRNHSTINIRYDIRNSPYLQ